MTLVESWSREEHGKIKCPVSKIAVPLLAPCPVV